LFATALAFGCAGAATDGFSQPVPGTVVLNKSRHSSAATNGDITINQKIGPFAAPVHVFLTAIGSARGSGGHSSLRTQILFGDLVHASNSDEFALPDGSLLEATANFDFILSKGQSTIAVARMFGQPNDIRETRLRFFYKAIVVQCAQPTVC
jgi:hypothetical protein